MPVCSNCGGNDFVWAENLKTGGLGRGGLSLRSGGELALGTRVCRGCGHADLFVKDPTVLRQPHTWKPGEFVPILPRPSVPQKPSEPAPVPAAPVVAPPRASPPAPPIAGPTPPSSPVAPTSPATTAPSASPSRQTATHGVPAEPPPVATSPSGPTDQSAREGDTARKRPVRRKGTKAKSETPPLIHE